jgi:VIT1/CCC1 family predicted Fe2+/Mn2+ transporter
MTLQELLDPTGPALQQYLSVQTAEHFIALIVGILMVVPFFFVKKDWPELAIGLALAGLGLGILLIGISAFNLFQIHYNPLGWAISELTS